MTAANAEAGCMVCDWLVLYGGQLAYILHTHGNEKSMQLTPPEIRWQNVSENVPKLGSCMLFMLMKVLENQSLR